MESSSEVLGPFTEIVRLSWTILADNIPTDLRWDRLLITSDLGVSALRAITWARC
jgi:hypothetical protein